MNPKAFSPFFLCLLVAGCSDKEDEALNRELDQQDEGMGIWFVTEYNGTGRGDDLDLWARFTVPSGRQDPATLQPDHWYQVNPRVHSGSISCFKYRDDFEGSWWLEVTLYDEPDGNVVNRQRWPDLDCLTYRIHVDKDGQMTDLYEGRWGDNPRENTPGPKAWTTLASVGGALLALRRR